MFPQKHFVFGPANINVFNIPSRTERLFLLRDATLQSFEWIYCHRVVIGSWTARWGFLHAEAGCLSLWWLLLDKFMQSWKPLTYRPVLVLAFKSLKYCMLVQVCVITWKQLLISAACAWPARWIRTSPGFNCWTSQITHLLWGFTDLTADVLS